ncbi:hypothetical protein PsorP6_009292 [Peronosclerospora sorghi]|uniref:Uncharacterized protein n=1 Tax=Peronosclerospora sorghi TaxID=230839 RepID=A0ACC0W093_9STRA|nr:hypothetical protein PsorP6_009292 [Peronosclerospora sorghi]
MPRLSQRQLILRDAYRSLEYACRDQILAGTDEELRQAYELGDDIFELPPESFNQAVRVLPETFEYILNLIKNDPVFINRSFCPQDAVSVQLSLALERLGMNGNGAAVKRIPRTAGVADGTVKLYTDRVISALVRLASEFVLWPQPEERREISRRIAQRSGIVGAVGIVDGTHINFAQRPAIDRKVFFSRKRRYGFNAQVIVDDRGMIRFFQTVLPASLYDSTAFTITPISKQPEQFFSENEFLLGDSGYTLTSRMLIHYRQPAASRPTNETFNLLHSRARVKRELRVHIRREADFKRACDWCSASVFLHNIVTTQRDDLDEDEDEEEPLQRTEIQEDGDISAAR